MSRYKKVTESTKFFIWESMLLDFDFLTEDAWEYLNLKASTDFHQISYKRLLTISAFRTKFELNNLKFAQWRQFREIFKKFKISINLNASIDFGQM